MGQITWICVLALPLIAFRLKQFNLQCSHFLILEMGIIVTVAESSRKLIEVIFMKN